MDKAEAYVAVEFNALCEHRGVIYYAYANERVKDPGKPLCEKLVLHDIKTNSLTYAMLETTKVVDWKAPLWLVEKRLGLIRPKLIE